MDLIQFTDDEKKLIKNQFFPQNTSNQEMAYCMGVAKSLGLNPITKEIQFIERWSKQNGKKIEPLIGRDGFLTIAHRSGFFGGIETSAEVKEIPFFNGSEWITKSELVATCKVWRTNSQMPFIVEVSYSEYAQKTKDGSITQFWRDKPITMIKKVAESQALRKAFNISGIYAEEEIHIDTEAKPTEQEEVIDDLNDFNPETGEIAQEIEQFEIEGVDNG